MCIQYLNTRRCANLDERNTIYKASKLCNSLPDSLKVIGTSKQFKNKLKIYLQLAHISGMLAHTNYS